MPQSNGDGETRDSVAQVIADLRVHAEAGYVGWRQIAEWANRLAALAAPTPPPDATEPTCEHGTALDVHCCGDGRPGGCHSGFFPPEDCACYQPKESAMDTRNGDIYENRELATSAGVPDEDLVTGSREALEKLRKKLVFTGGSFKTVEQDEARKSVLREKDHA